MLEKTVHKQRGIVYMDMPLEFSAKTSIVSEDLLKREQENLAKMYNYIVFSVTEGLKRASTKKDSLLHVTENFK